MFQYKLYKCQWEKEGGGLITKGFVLYINLPTYIDTHLFAFDISNKQGSHAYNVVQLFPTIPTVRYQAVKVLMIRIENYYPDIVLYINFSLIMY